MKIKFKILAFIFVAALIFTMISSGCKKKDKLFPDTPVEYGSMTDIDGNVYKTVKIGNQWWMAENLKVRTYKNGTPIKEVTLTDPDSLWAQATKGYFCEFQYSSDFSKVYGLLYNWYTVSDTNKIAPEGWHVASDDDWKQLEIYMGMSSADAAGVNWRGNQEADKLKIHSPDGWTGYGNVWSDNSSGFTALAGACRIFNGLWADPNIKSTGFWWTSTSHPENKAWFRNLDYKKTNVFRYYTYKSYGMSIRCVKD